MNLNWTVIARALVLSIVVAILQYLLKVGDLWMLDFHTIINNAVLAGAGSLLTSIGTSSTTGKFAGAVPVEEK